MYNLFFVRVLYEMELRNSHVFHIFKNVHILVVMVVHFYYEDGRMSLGTVQNKTSERRYNLVAFFSGIWYKNHDRF